MLKAKTSILFLTILFIHSSFSSNLLASIRAFCAAYLVDQFKTPTQKLEKIIRVSQSYPTRSSLVEEWLRTIKERLSQTNTPQPNIIVRGPIVASSLDWATYQLQKIQTLLQENNSFDGTMKDSIFKKIDTLLVELSFAKTQNVVESLQFLLMMEQVVSTLSKINILMEKSAPSMRLFPNEGPMDLKGYSSVFGYHINQPIEDNRTLVLIPTEKPLDFDSFNETLPYAIQPVGLTNTDVFADGVRYNPYGLFEHDLLHFGVIYSKNREIYQGAFPRIDALNYLYLEERLSFHQKYHEFLDQLPTNRHKMIFRALWFEVYRELGQNISVNYGPAFLKTQLKRQGFMIRDSSPQRNLILNASFAQHLTHRLQDRTDFGQAFRVAPSFTEVTEIVEWTLNYFLQKNQ